MNNTMAMKKPFPIAAIFFLVYGFLRLCTFGYQIYTSIVDGYSLDIIDESVRALIPLTFLALGIILLITGKNTIALPIISCIMMICWDLYWLILNLKSYFEYTFDIYDLCPLLGYFTDIAAFVLLILFTILSIVYKKKKCGLLVVWFIPGILFSVSEFLYNYDILTDIEYFLSLFKYESGIIYFIHILSATLLFIPSMFLFGYWLYKENKYKAVLSTTPMTIPSYNEDSAVPAFDPDINTVSQSVEQTPSYRDQYNTPNRQNYTQVPSYNYQGNFQMQQPAYNTQNTFPTQQPVYTQHTPQEQLHVTDELLKYKHLLDVGAITAEDYEIKKKQLLGI